MADAQNKMAFQLDAQGVPKNKNGNFVEKNLRFVPKKPQKKSVFRGLEGSLKRLRNSFGMYVTLMMLKLTGLPFSWMREVILP